ncbi:tissue factor pathway inhibitor a isoform X1 [Gadus morhua]|uniref:Tissue factor pathway inhibitor n=1 Tax=Gadus morhua TaxID=8049 RepID=A0A8C4ZTX2_GADMO|nr:tissue factor pathway inhibitor-like isoform X1 [Gadus morhua]
MAAINTGWILCVFSLCFGSVSQAFHRAHQALEAQAAPFIFNELCVMKEDAGPCKAMKDHFFFDIDVGRCRLFEYGGCGGNDNNFQTIEACEQTCLVSADKSPCNLEEAPGPCRGMVTRYFFNRVSRECQQFYYGGCFGNANNFRSIAECQAKCQNPAKATKEPVAAVRDLEPTNSSEIQPLIIKEEVLVQLASIPDISVRQPAVFSTPSFCLLSIEEGPCHATKRRFAYNPLTQKCSIFPYGGCEGNKNNFVYKRQCMKICMNVHHHRSGMIRIKRKNIVIQPALG